MSSVDGRRRPRAAFFDAGNTLLRMDYAAIARAVRRHGLRVRAAALERAEWRARVRLDDEVLAATAVSTESGATGDRYLQLLLEEIGVTDAQIVQAVEAWRRDSRACGDDLEAEVAAEAAQLERDYTDDRLERIVRSNGEEEQE